jgi:hypothetical protein
VFLYTWQNCSFHKSGRAWTIKNLHLLISFQYKGIHDLLFLCSVVQMSWVSQSYKACSKEDRTSAIKTLLLILQNLKHCPLQSSLNRAQRYITCVSLDGAMHPRVYKACSKKDRTFTIMTSLLILQHFKHCPLQSSPLYWRYTIPNVCSVVGMLPGTHFL